MGILFTIPLGFPLTIMVGFLFTIRVGFQFTVSIPTSHFLKMALFALNALFRANEGHITGSVFGIRAIKL
jgi:hypothetical protein